jgi:ubiquinone/menaquinone biosynthesis C-methylase UbiE
VNAIQQKQDVAGLFNRAAPVYGTGDDFFADVARGLVAHAAPQPGERALDIGCGRGAVLFPVAEAVGPTGRVTGIDLSPSMVELTSKEAEKLRLKTVDVHIGDAEDPDFPGSSFDLITGGMVMFFLPDIPAALRHYAKILKPGGRITMSTFVANDRLRWQPVERTLVEFMPEPPPPAPQQHLDPHSWSDGLLTQLEESDYIQIEVVEQQYDNVFPTPERWWAWTESMATRAAIEAIPADRRDEARRAAFAALETIRDESGRIVWSAVMRFTKAVAGQR